MLTIIVNFKRISHLALVFLLALNMYFPAGKVLIPIMTSQRLKLIRWFKIYKNEYLKRTEYFLSINHKLCLKNYHFIAEVTFKLSERKNFAQEIHLFHQINQIKHTIFIDEIFDELFMYVIPSSAIQTFYRYHCFYVFIQPKK